MIFKGFWHPADSAARYPAQLQVDAEGEFQLSHDNTHAPISGQTQQLQFSQRIGNIPRKVTLPDHSLFESSDNDAIDRWLASAKHSDAGALWMNTLESRWRWIGLALLGTILIGAASVFWGLPWASKKIAHQLPMGANRAIAEGTLSTLDEFIMKPSKLNKKQQDTVRENFTKMLTSIHGQGFEYKLHFRDMSGMANAFALPSGDVVVTDKLVELVLTDELNSILLHEIGHVEHRHGMRQVIQSSAVTLGLIMVTGDATSIDGWTTALPAFLLQSKYSRNFETEADVFAFEHMIKQGIDPAIFGKAIQRITKDAEGGGSGSEALGKKTEQALEYMSSHPASDKRAAMSKEYSKRYQEQRNQTPQE